MFITIPDPESPVYNMPIYEGESHVVYHQLVPGLYAATAYHGDEAATGLPIYEDGYVFVWDGTRDFPSVGITAGSPGSVFLGESCGVLGCDITDPHEHTMRYFFGEPGTGGIDTEICPA